MDPQACLQQIIDALNAIRPLPWGDTRLDGYKDQIDEAFENLATWLKGGGFAPYAVGPIFGTGPRAIGYPGMTRDSLPRYEPHVIRHVHNCAHHWRFAIMVSDHLDQECKAWEMHQYNHAGESVHCWPFATTKHEQSAK